MDISANESVPVSKGPKLLGIGEASFDSSKLNNAVTCIVISENTLQHYRADAARRRSRIDSMKLQSAWILRSATILTGTSSKRT